MGQFFTNIQVLRVGSGRKFDREELARYIMTALGAQGLHEVSTPAENDRRVQVGGVSEGRWLAVLDTATEGQDTARLDHMAEIISTVAGTTAISILVHDGDRLQMSLFRGGTKRDSIDSWPGYFEGEAPSASASDFTAWADLLPPGKSIDDLRRAWTPVHLDEGALPRLRRIAQVLGMHSDQCTLGANSLPATMASEFRTLAFASGPPLNDIVVSRLPVLGHTGGLKSATKIGIGESRILTMIAHSTGASGTGIRLIVWGRALEVGLVRVVCASIIIGGPEDAVTIQLELVKQPTSSGIVLVSTIDDVSMPAGYTGPGDAFAAAGGDVVRGMAMWMDTRVSVDLQLIGVQSGAGDLHFCLQPLTNHDGQALLSTRVRVEPLG